jgi:hypothetical protein
MALSFIRHVIGRAPGRVPRAIAAGLLGCGLAAITAPSATAAPPATAAGVVFVGAPGTSAPPATLGSASTVLYSMLPFGRDGQAAGASVSTVAGPLEPLTPSGSAATGAVRFSTALKHCLIGGCWNTWSNGYKGDVYVSASRTITITLPPTNAFYFYAEPNKYMTFTMTATTRSGATSGPIPVAGYAGAKFFGFYTTGTTTLASITVTGADPSGFAIGEFGISAPYQFILPDSSIRNPDALSSTRHRGGTGIGIPVPAGSPYYAITAGTVTRMTSWGACRKGVILRGGDGVQYTYCGGSQWLVPNGASVAAGTELGVVRPARAHGPSRLWFAIAYPATGPRVRRRPQSLLLALYDNSVHGTLGAVPNPRTLPAAGCGR